MSSLTKVPLDIFTDSKCSFPNLTIPDPFHAYRQCAQDLLLLYSSPIIASCEPDLNGLPLIKIGICPISLRDYSIYNVSLEEGCRLIGSSSSAMYYISQACSSKGFTASPKPAKVEPESLQTSAMNPLTLLISIVIAVILVACCCSCCYLKRRRKKQAGRLKKIIARM